MKGMMKKLLVTAFAVILVVFVFGLGMLTGSVFSDGLTSKSELPENFATFEKVYQVLVDEFYFGDNSSEYQQQIIVDAINGMVNAQGDIHTQYLSKEQLDSFTSSLESSFVGIGVVYTALEDSLLVKEPLKGSPAEEAGIRCGDIIVAIDSVRITKENKDQVVDLIKGKVGSVVTITILRDGKEQDVAITRKEISNTVFSSYQGEGIGVLELTSFSDGTGKEVGYHLKDLVEQGATKLIIDLRDNGGGYAKTLDEICGFFMNTGDIIMREVDREGNEIIDRCKSSQKYDFEKIVILVNEGSASCSEVFTMAMKENCGAIVVGETTYGKGVAQLTKLFADGSALKYTDMAWKSGNGVYVGESGIEPDYKVRLPEVLYLQYLTMEENEELKYDTVNEKTINIQMMLDFLGYPVDRFDGYYSLATAKAVGQFQQDCGLEVTEIVNRQVASTMNSKVIFQWQNNQQQLDSQMNKALELLKN